MLLKKWEQLPPEMQTDEVRKYYDILKKKQGSLFFKRVFDIIASLVLLVILSPVFLILAVAIKLDSKGPTSSDILGRPRWRKNTALTPGGRNSFYRRSTESIFTSINSAQWYKTPTRAHRLLSAMTAVLHASGKSSGTAGWTRLRSCSTPYRARSHWLVCGLRARNMLPNIRQR